MVGGFEAEGAGADGAVSVAMAADSGRTTQIKSPETIPQDDNVCPVSVRLSKPFRDKPKSVPSLMNRNHNKKKHKINLCCQTNITADTFL